MNREERRAMQYSDFKDGEIIREWKNEQYDTCPAAAF
jgi:hypothetical protein